MPDFNLLDLSGKNHSLRRADGWAVVLFFTGNGCPIARKSVAKLHQLRRQFGEQGVEFQLINTYAGDTLKDTRHESNELGVRQLSYLRDPRQAVALSFGVQRTAEVVAIRTDDWSVFYQGAIDDLLGQGADCGQPGQRFLATPLDEFLGGKPVTTAKSPSKGCRFTFSSATEVGG